ncbi:MAG: DUF4337 domain-containing protein [Magnetococcales bacterium]|nr:DUF4337 family protein [Magnetococcales bacterium]NGZ28543.1 DUF4337 domain-containing protein [Magnetococcales bacterium]
MFKIDINNEKVRDIIGLLIGIITIPMAVSTLHWSNTTSETITMSINEANTYGFYQGKAVRKAMTQLRIYDLEMDLKINPPEKPEHLEVIKERMAKLRQAADTYESDPKTGEGKKELLEKAKAIEAKRDHMSTSSTYYGNAMILLQLSIILASTALTVRVGLLLVPAAAFMLFGLFVLMDAAMVFFPIPFF